MNQIDFNSQNASFEFTKSLKEIGFAVIYNHSIDYNLVLEVFEEWKKFFNSNYKNDYLYSNDTQDGFFPSNISETAVGYKEKDLKEFYHYYPWGKFPKQLSNKTNKLYDNLNNLAITLLNWVEVALPSEIRNSLSEPLTNMIKNSTQTLMRVLHYPPIEKHVGEKVRAAAHGDINLLTILVAASSTGLQVQNLDGKWINVPVDPGMLAINIGDMLEEATNRFYKSTLHRVINPNEKENNISRYSIPLFLHPRPEVVLSSRYKAGEFLQERLTSLGIKK